ncbi:hypothetical protein QD712_25980 [Streptomyces acidiscabies]
MPPIPAEPFDFLDPEPVPAPRPGCVQCGDLAEERAQAAKAGDLSRVSDCNVRIRTHDTGHAGNPGNPGTS